MFENLYTAITIIIGVLAFSAFVYSKVKEKQRQEAQRNNKSSSESSTD